MVSSWHCAWHFIKIENLRQTEIFRPERSVSKEESLVWLLRLSLYGITYTGLTEFLKYK